MNSLCFRFKFQQNNRQERVGSTIEIIVKALRKLLSVKMHSKNYSNQLARSSTKRKIIEIENIVFSKNKLKQMK
jgi:hypothetical protein